MVQATYWIALCQALGNLPKQLIVCEIPDTLRSLEKSMDKGTADFNIFLGNPGISHLCKLVFEWSIETHDPLDEFGCFDSFVKTLAI